MKNKAKFENVVKAAELIVKLNNKLKCSAEWVPEDYYDIMDLADLTDVFEDGFGHIRAGDGTNVKYESIAQMLKICCAQIKLTA